jgi:cytochrome c5
MLMAERIYTTMRSILSEARRYFALTFIVALAVCIAPEDAAAQSPERSGKEVVDSVCIACHGTGAHGAPKIGNKKAWAKLASRGLTGLSRNALQGIRQMPPHGGNPSLTDTEIERAITYMVNQSGGHWKEPVSRTAKAPERSGAPKIGDRSAWIPRLKPGLDVVVRSAINGHGGMPARGGLADLTDSELRSAIIYMFNKGTVPEKSP